MASWHWNPSDEIILAKVAKGDYEAADKLSRLEALDAYHHLVSKWPLPKKLEFIDAVTGGLGYTRDEPLDPFRMGLAGSVIAWPEAVARGSRVLEIGTGLGRTRYAVHVCTSTSLYLTIDVSREMLAIALYANPIPAYQEALWQPDTRIVLGDAVRVLRLLPPGLFDHVVHDGGPNPRRNPRLYSTHVIAEIARVLRPGGTLSIFAGAERRMQDAIYKRLVSAGFRVVETVHLPGSKAVVIHAVLEESAARPRSSPGR